VTTLRIVGDVVELDGRAVARLLPDVRAWLRRNLTNEIADIEEWLERQVEYLEESEAEKAEEDARNTPPLTEQSRTPNRCRRQASAGTGLTRAPLREMARITVCGRRCVISTP
jgi:hypothetical protein